MKSELTEVSPTQKEIKIEIDPALLKESYGKVSQKYAKRASVPGFRRGYAPLDVVRLRAHVVRLLDFLGLPGPLRRTRGDATGVAQRESRQQCPTTDAALSAAGLA